MRNSFENAASAMQRAHALAQSGDLKGAAQLCREILALEPSYFYALFMLGTIESNLGQYDDAEGHLARALKIEPRSPDALTSYGNVLLELKRFEPAVERLNEALRIQPQNLNARIYRGLGLAEMKRHEDALKDFDFVLQHDPQSIFALHNRTNILIALNRAAEARRTVELLLRIAPGYAPAISNYALLLRQEKKYPEAIAVLDRALAIAPHNPDLFHSRGHALMGMKRLDEALACFDRAIQLKPGSASFQIARGNVFSMMQRYDDARTAVSQAISLDPRNVETHFGLANILMEQNQLDGAIRAIDEALDINADYAPALVLRANVLLHRSNTQEALAAYDRAIAVKPDYAEAYYNRGSALLLHGQFKKGFRDFEHRWSVAECGFDRPTLRAAHWQGEKLAGRSIVVYSEQGMGDAIQFARFLPRLLEMGAKLTFLCHPGLVRLFRPYANRMELTASSEAGRVYDFQCALMSLPERFGIELETVPKTVPYVFAEEALATRWHERIGQDRFRIGLCWQGNPLGLVDRGRSIPLAHYRPLSEIAGIRLISLQRNHGLDQLLRLPPNMTIETLGNFDEGKDAFIDTAAIMENLDLVITSDTAIAHLAGALGRPVWVALKHIPDWRWMLDRNDSPWYPTMRLFRQPKPGDWESVFAKIADALPSLMRKDTAL